MPERAQFEVRDVGSASGGADTGGNKKYMGVERRRAHRRTGMDRRTDVRFEPGKDDRRQNHGRRHDDEDGYRFLS
ncbi:hypothetical protein [Seongchinamella sediminis]|nr:hypothetical protein [Seongchinamella sediminis]